MTISNQCKFASFFVMSVSVILLLVLFYRLDHNCEERCERKDEYMFNTTGECYPRMEQGPCHHNLIFMEDEPNGKYGSCNCPYMFENRSMVYHAGTCYHVFTQGYCSEGHWLTVDKKGLPLCEKNHCLQHQKNGIDLGTNANDDGEEDAKSADQIDVSMNKTNAHYGTSITEELVPLKNGMCARLGKTMEGCPKGAVVRFHRNYVYPSCFEPPQLSMGAIGVGPYSSCPLGSYRSIMGKCQPTFDFDFDSTQTDDDSPEYSQRS